MYWNNNKEAAGEKKVGAAGEKAKPASTTGTKK
jgi:hypothetical protein